MHQSITFMKEYKTKTFEELQFEDYCANRKFKQGAVSGGKYGSTTPTTTGLFGANDNKQIFKTSTASAFGGFGNTDTSNIFVTQSSKFEKPQQPTQTQISRMNTQPSIFELNTAQTLKPFGVAAPQTNIFGSTPTTTASTLLSTQFSGFGHSNQNNLFSQNIPEFGIGLTQTTTDFGTNIFTSANGSGSKLVDTGFQTTQAFDASNAFGVSTLTAQSATGSLMGSNPFNKPSTTSLFSQPENQLTGGLNNTVKPRELFGQGKLKTELIGSSYNSGGISFLSSNQQSGRIELSGNTINVQSSTISNNQIQLQLDTFKLMPYGDSPLFKRFYKDILKVDDSSPIRSKNISLGTFGSYRVSSIPTLKSASQIHRNFPRFHKKSLFDGLGKSVPIIKDHNKINYNSQLNNVSSPKSMFKKLNLKKDINESIKLINGINMNMHTKPFAKLESYFYNKQNLPEDLSNENNSSLINENINFGQSHSIKQIKFNTSNKIEVHETFKNYNTDTIIDNQLSLTDSLVSQNGHPSRIKLKRIGYYTIPPMNKLTKLVDKYGLCIVDGFTIGRYDYGNVYFPDRFNVAGLDLDSIVHIRHKEIIIYQDEEMKPPLGEGLNRRATVTLDRVWPNDKTTKLPIINSDRIAGIHFVAKLQRACATLGTQFVDYHSHTGSWVFNVEHFSKYGFVDSDNDRKKVGHHTLDIRTELKFTLPKPKAIKLLGNESSSKNTTPLLDLTVGVWIELNPYNNIY